MQRSFVSLLLVCLAAVPAAAQDFAPPAELAAYDRLIGDFKGTGKVWFEPGAEPTSWNSRVRTEKVLGGHFVREHMVVDFGEEMPRLVFYTFYGFDRALGRHVKYLVNNMGEIQRADVAWKDDVMISTSSAFRLGEPNCERWQIRVGDGGYEVFIEGADGTTPFRPHVEGRYARTTDAKAPQTVEAAFGLPAAPAEIGRLAKLAGTYRIAGEMSVAPDQPAIPIAGTQTTRAIFGGTVVEDVVIGEPSPMGDYEAWGATVWDPVDNRYVCLYLSSMGEVNMGFGNFVGDDFCATTSRMTMGVPTTERTTMRIENGAYTGAVVDMISGSAAPFRSFKATYTAQ